MTYATQANLIDRFSEAQLLQIADQDGDDVLDTDVIDRALADADAECDSYIGVRYDLPLPSTPARLVGVAADIAFYRLHPAAQPEDVRTRYLDALKWLQAVATGNAILDVGGEEPSQQGGGQVEITQSQRVFSRDKLVGF